MSLFEMTKQVAAPPDKVFETFANFKDAARNVRGIEELEILTDGPVGVGTRFKETRIMFKKRATEEMEVTIFDRPSLFTVEAHSCGAHYVTAHRFTSEGAGTRVTVEFDARPVTFLAKLFAPLSSLMLKSCAKMFERDMEDVRSLLEGSGTSGDDKANAQVAGGSA